MEDEDEDDNDDDEEDGEDDVIIFSLKLSHFSDSLYFIPNHQLNNSNLKNRPTSSMFTIL